MFKLVLDYKTQKAKPSIDQLNTVFEDYYRAIEKLGGTKKKGEKYITLEEFNKIYAQVC